MRQTVATSSVPLLALLALFASANTTAFAQLGVSPSQNAAFLDELRGRDAALTDRYRDPLGDARTMLEEGRELSRPSFFSDSDSRARRLGFDFTTYPSQYQLGRSYLTPWYDGVRAPDETWRHPSGATLGVAVEQTIEYLSGFVGKGLYSHTYLLLDGAYQVADNQRLTIASGIGINPAIDESDAYNHQWQAKWGLTLQPGSTIAYDIDLGPVFITVYDRVSMRTNLFRPILQNDLGIAATWQVAPRLAATINFSRSWIDDTTRRQPFDQHIHAELDSVIGLISYDVCPALTVGMEAARSWIEHEGLIGFNEGTLSSVGGFIDVRLGRNDRLRLSGGYQQLRFDSSGLAVPFPPFPFAFAYDNSDFSGPYAGLSYSARISDRLSHELALGYESTLDVSANYNTSKYANYGLTAEVWEGGRATASGLFETSVDSDSPFSTAVTSWGFDLHLSQRLTSRLSASAAYSYGQFDFEAPRPFSIVFVPNEKQHAVGVKLMFEVTKRIDATLNWVWRSTEFDRFGDAEQQRLSFGVRVQL